ncbi:36.4 kDa proline-rich protein [Amaranthus tricolor]|uniref:36.4 kDa proline-rich protein n=1 Tax=Amaranthus tricolor TaxID=29722 RepID=UPI0025882EC3|nr:36.4 kDa proline-rich protein [Amaranthus tricolor]
MDSSKLSALLFICMFLCSSISPILGCGECGQPTHKPKKGTGKPISHPPVTVPKLPVPPVTVPKLPVPPVTVPKLPVPPVTVPKLPVPPVTGIVPPVTGIIPPVTGIVPPVTGVVPKLPVPPVTGVVPPVAGVVPKLPVPPVTGLIPPVLNPPSTPSGKPCAPGTPAPKSKDKCPINVLKLGACVDLLGGLVHVGLGDPAVNKCCPILKGIAEAEAAICLCTALKSKVLDLNVYVPIALQLLLTCGKTPPPGFTCSL